jgi:putative ABC transport system permease protein
MNVAVLAWRWLWARPLQAVLNLLLLALGLASITFVLLAGARVQQAFQRDLAGIDAVVGAKGSPMQLILAGVFQIDVSPGNVKLADVQALARHPQVAQVIPLSMGDSAAGFRVLGTTPDYLAHFRLALAGGRAWQAPMEAVLGAQVARTTGWQPGQAFTTSHGLGGGPGHDDHPFTVAGVLAPCGCVADRLVLTSLESVWDMHAGHGPAPAAAAGATPAAAQASAHDHDHDHGKDDAKGHAHAHGPQASKGTTAAKGTKGTKGTKAPTAAAAASPAPDTREVSMALVRYATPLAAVSFPRQVNATTALQAASPALEVSRLLRLLGVGTDVLRAVAGVLLLAAMLSVFIALWTAVRERRADLAMLRMLGAPPARIAGVLLGQALWLALLASVAGVAAGWGLTALVGSVLEARGSLPLATLDLRSLPLAQLAWVPLLAAGAALLAALLPAWGAYRVDPAHLLHAR